MGPRFGRARAGDIFDGILAGVVEFWDEESVGPPNRNYGAVLCCSLAQWWSWGLIAPLIFWIDARLPFKENQLRMRILAHLLASMPLTLLCFCVAIVMSASLGLVKWIALAHPLSLLNTFGLLKPCALQHSLQYKRKLQSMPRYEMPQPLGTGPCARIYVLGH